MVRATGEWQLLPVAARIRARAGLRYVSDEVAGHRAAALGQGVPLPRPGRPRRARSRHAGAHPRARDPARMDARCGSARATTATCRPRTRRAAAQAVPLSPRAGARCATRPSTGAWSRSPRALPRIRRARAARPRAAGPAAREGARDGGAPARDHAHPRRQRGVRARERVVRPHHAARAPGAGQRRQAQLPLSRQERRAARHRAHRPAPRRNRAPHAGPARRGAVPVRRRRRRDAAASSRPTSTPI